MQDYHAFRQCSESRPALHFTRIFISTESGKIQSELTSESPICSDNNSFYAKLYVVVTQKVTCSITSSNNVRVSAFCHHMTTSNHARMRPNSLNVWPSFPDMQQCLLAYKLQKHLVQPFFNTQVDGKWCVCPAMY